jgi:hypothetical protein
MKLMEFDYLIEYKKGKENIAVDALSQKYHTFAAISTATLAWTNDIEESYVNDPHYANLLEQLLVNPQVVPDHTVHSGIVRFKGEICIGATTDLRNKILIALHSSPIGGHSGIRATYQRVKRIFYWPTLKKAVENYVTQCSMCQRAKAEHCHYLRLFAPLPIPIMAWTFISMDFIEGLPKSSGKMSYWW